MREARGTRHEVSNQLDFTLQTCYHYGLVTVSDGKCRPQTTRIKLSSDLLVLQREEFIFPDEDNGYPVDNKVYSMINHGTVDDYRDNHVFIQRLFCLYLRDRYILCNYTGIHF
jgi:hypothetical protein